jgi:hypothetical protein
MQYNTDINFCICVTWSYPFEETRSNDSNECDVYHAFWMVHQNRERFVPNAVLSETLHSILPNFQMVKCVYLLPLVATPFFGSFLIQKF